jgi:hypothetical protein
MTYTGHLLIETFKEGLFSRVAHNLRFRLAPCEIRRIGQQFTGQFPLNSIHLEGALKDGRLAPDLLSAKDKSKILHTVHHTILRSQAHPLVGLKGTVSGTHFQGQLRICGRLAPLNCHLEESSTVVSGAVEITPSHWGIPPFKALFGAIQLQDRVRVGFEFRPSTTSQ